MNPLTTVLVKALEVIFLAGVAGSAVVLVLTTIEDIASMLEKEVAPGVDAVKPEV